jgi:hypothetical protein
MFQFKFVHSIVEKNFILNITRNGFTVPTCCEEIMKRKNYTDFIMVNMD